MVYSIFHCYLLSSLLYLFYVCMYVSLFIYVFVYVCMYILYICISCILRKTFLLISGTFCKHVCLYYKSSIKLNRSARVCCEMVYFHLLHCLYIFNYYHNCMFIGFMYVYLVWHDCMSIYFVLYVYCICMYIPCVCMFIYGYIYVYVCRHFFCILT